MITTSETTIGNQAIIDAANTAVADAGDGRISKSDADILIDIYHQNPDEDTMQALKQVRNNYKWTRAAIEHLKSVIPSFSILPLPAPAAVFGASRSKMGLVFDNDTITAINRGYDSNSIYFEHWNPFSNPNKSAGAHKTAGSTLCGIATTATEDNKQLGAMVGSVDLLYYFDIDGTSVNFHNPAIPGLKDTPAITRNGESIYYACVDTNKILLLSSNIEELGSITFLPSVDQPGYNKTNFGPAILPIVINVDTLNGLQEVQKIMIAWLSSENSDKLCSVLYDPADQTYSHFECYHEYTGASSLSLEHTPEGDVMVVSGFKDDSYSHDYFDSAIFTINRNSAGGSWGNFKQIDTYNNQVARYAPTLLAIGDELYLFYTVKDGGKITYIRVA